MIKTAQWPAARDLSSMQYGSFAHTHAVVNEAASFFMDHLRSNQSTARCRAPRPSIMRLLGFSFGKLFDDITVSY